MVLYFAEEAIRRNRCMVPVRIRWYMSKVIWPARLSRKTELGKWFWKTMKRIFRTSGERIWSVTLVVGQIIRIVKRPGVRLGCAIRRKSKGDFDDFRSWTCCSALYFCLQIHHFSAHFYVSNPGFCPLFPGFLHFWQEKIGGVKAFTCAFAQKKWAKAHFQNPKVGENYV